METTLGCDPFDKEDWMQDDISVSTPPQDFVICSTPVSSGKRKSDFHNPVPKRTPPMNCEKGKSTSDVTPTTPNTSTCRLPEPCPLPSTYSRKTTEAIEQGNLLGTAKTRLLREAATFYFGICSGRCCSSDYVTIAKTLCREYPQLKDKMAPNGEYWVINCCSVELICI